MIGTNVIACMHHSDMGMGTRDTGTKRGTLWCHDDYRLLFEALELGLDVDEIAEHIERDPGGVHNRAWMLTEKATTKSRALNFLRRVAAEPRFEWEEFVRDVHSRISLPYWDLAADATLIQAWAAQPHPTMQELTQQLGITNDAAIARRCIQLQLTDNRAEVVDVLGAIEGSELHINSMLARDKAATALWVLVLTSGDGEVLHVSTYGASDQAIAAAHRIDTERLTADPARWSIAVRVAGEGSARQMDSGPWSDVLERKVTAPSVHSVTPRPRRGRWLEIFRRSRPS